VFWSIKVVDETEVDDFDQSGMVNESS